MRDVQVVRRVFQYRPYPRAGMIVVVVMRLRGRPKWRLIPGPQEKESADENRDRDTQNHS